MTATAGSQLLGPWYDILSAVVMSGIFFSLAFRLPALPSAVQKRIPAFLGKKACIALGVGAAVMAFFEAVNMPAPTKAIDGATMTVFGAAPEWKVIQTGSEGDTLSVDLKTIVRNGNMVGYWEQVVFKTPKPYRMPAGMVKSMNARLLVNCADRTRVLQEFVVVRLDGSTVSQDKSEAPPVLPLSTDPARTEYISSHYMCGRRVPS